MKPTADPDLLRELERVVEGRVLVLRLGPDNDVHLEEGVEDVDVCREQVGLGEGGDLDDL